MLGDDHVLPGQVPQQQGGGPGQLLPAQVAGGVLYPASSLSTGSDTEAYQGIVMCVVMFILFSLQAVLHLVVWYSGPGQYNNHNNEVTMEEEVEEDQQALINLERNIANLERSMSASQLERGDMNSLLGKQVRMAMMMVKMIV